ncbi:MAG TPA: hypothetical protein DHW02_13225 [Ktedonobacter sp.]|nr:hypothetical protein [Ktedonobacter sp.]
MDAPISITLAHLIIIWTLTLFLIAWMLLSAILAFRSRYHNPLKPEVLQKRSDESSDTIDTPRAAIASPFSLYQATPVTDSSPHHAVTTTSNEISATPVI